MTKMIKGLGVATLIAAGSFGYAHADAKMMMEGAAACNSSYSQCLSGSDMSIASTPQAGMEKIKMNMMHAQECGAALRACYSGLK
ncbi:MAG: hypothetical protein KDJ48_12345 [Nitratireductor sp.]|nr:hypothetical protein [Nitratireductor sp.]MCB1455312.1 hypothetical protein [Nitratireductor sp.]MCB1460030.1 hypothetical protein [Nitratireductor sp.]